MVTKTINNVLRWAGLIHRHGFLYVYNYTHVLGTNLTWEGFVSLESTTGACKLRESFQGL